MNKNAIKNNTNESHQHDDDDDTYDNTIAVASEKGMRRNYLPLIVLLVIVIGGTVGGYLVYQSYRADRANAKNQIGGTASSKSAISNKADEKTKRLGVEGEDENSAPKALTPTVKPVPAIVQDNKAIPLQGQQGQYGNQNMPPPRSRFDAPSNFDNAGSGMPGMGGNPYPNTYPAYAPRNTTGNTADRVNYNIPPVPQNNVAPQGSDRHGLNLSTINTQAARASMLGDRHFILPKGSFIDCDLDTAIDSTVPGMVRCTVTKDAYSDNGRVVLVGRGSVVTGEYRSDIKNGEARIQVLWNRIRTPEGVVIEPSSPASDSLGRGGVDGEVDNHWFARMGAAFLTSIIKDAIAYGTAKNTNSAYSDNAYHNTTQSGEQMSSKILEQTINIPPTIRRNQGTRVKVYLARDLDFSNVYSLKVIP